MEISELKSIIEKSGLSAYKIEKDLKIPNGTLGQVLKGKKVLPQKYEAALRELVAIVKLRYADVKPDIPVEWPNVTHVGRDESGVNEDEATLEIEQSEEPISVNNYGYDPEQGEIDLNEYEKIEADSDKFVGEVMQGEDISLNVDALPKGGIDNIDFGNIHLETKRKEVKRPLMDIADLL